MPHFYHLRWVYCNALKLTKLARIVRLKKVVKDVIKAHPELAHDVRMNIFIRFLDTFKYIGAIIMLGHFG